MALYNILTAAVVSPDPTRRSGQEGMEGGRGMKGEKKNPPVHLHTWTACDSGRHEGGLLNWIPALWAGFRGLRGKGEEGPSYSWPRVSMSMSG